MLATSGSLKMLCGPRIGKFLKAESGMLVSRDWGTGRNGEFMFNGHRGFVRDDEKVREMGDGDGCPTSGMCLMLLNCTQKWQV